MFVCLFVCLLLLLLLHGPIKCVSNVENFHIILHPRFVPVAESEDGVEVLWPDGDKTLIQCDHASVSPDSTQLEIMSLYRFLVLLERVKRITSYKLSYSECTREEGQGSQDKFKITVKDAHKFKVVSSGSDRVSCKSFFGASMAAVAASNLLKSLFRWRFERVHACCKIQKPYVITSKVIELAAGKPAQCA